MSKRNKHKHDYGGKTRRDRREEINQRELMEAKHGIIDGAVDTDVAIGTEVAPLQNDMGKPDTARGKPQKWYILDTNLILSCVDILYDPDDEDWREPPKFQPNLRDAHLIIPETAFKELERIKDEDKTISFRKITAKIALRRLMRFFPNSERTFREVMNLESPIRTGLGKQTISLMPLHKDFSKSLPWVPAMRDNDGWIAVTALAATMLRDGMKVDGSVAAKDMLDYHNERQDVFLLTHDYGLMSKADSYGVKTKDYSFVRQSPFVGRRNLIVPAEMFEEFYYKEKLSREDFERYMPDEPPLVANEYIVMTPENDSYPRSYFAAGTSFANIARYHKENDTLYPLRFAKHEGMTPHNAGIATYYDAMNDDKINVVIVTGEPGTGKTYQAITHAIREVRMGRRSKIVLITSSTGKDDLGALPGSLARKMEPIVAFCKDTIGSYLARTPEFRQKREQLKKYGDTGREVDINEADTRNNSKKAKHRKNNNYYSIDDYDEDMLASDLGEQHSKKKTAKMDAKANSMTKKEHHQSLSYDEQLQKQIDNIFKRYFVCLTYKQTAGRTFEDAFVIIDEAQRIHDLGDLLTNTTRSGAHSKTFICGDIGQIHNITPEKLFKNGIIYARSRFFNWQKCCNIHLTDNMRGGTSEYETPNYKKAYRRLGMI